MKDDSPCVKCQSTAAIRIPGKASPYGGANIPLPGLHFRLDDSWVKVTRYVCLSCGFIEEYVEPEEFAKLRAAFPEAR